MKILLDFVDYSQPLAHKLEEEVDVTTFDVY